jgi:hypothetical protein
MMAARHSTAALQTTRYSSPTRRRASAASHATIPSSPCSPWAVGGGNALRSPTASQWQWCVLRHEQRCWLGDVLHALGLTRWPRCSAEVGELHNQAALLLYFQARCDEAARHATTALDITRSLFGSTNMLTAHRCAGAVVALSPACLHAASTAQGLQWPAANRRRVLHCPD